MTGTKGWSDVQRRDLAGWAKLAWEVLPAVQPCTTLCRGGGGRSGLQPSNPACKDPWALLVPTSRPPALVSSWFLVNAEKKHFFFFSFWMRLSKGAQRPLCPGTGWAGWLEVTLLSGGQGPVSALWDWGHHMWQQVLTFLQETTEELPTLAP